MDYSVFPPINASLNTLSTILLLTGFFLIKAGKIEAHKRVMLGALASSAVFLACYLVYHYGVGHTTFPKEYPVARVVYLSILIPHIILAVVNVPLIILLVFAAFRGKFERHKRLARFTFPSWLFVSVTGVIIYFMIYVWFPPSGKSGDPSTSAVETTADPAAPGAVASGTDAAGTKRGEPKVAGNLVFDPGFQEVAAEPGQTRVAVVFQVTNRGEKPGSIERLVSGCECLSVEVDRNPIPPGETATITGVFDTTKMRGRFERKITVELADRFRPVYLAARINKAPLYTVDPPMTTWKVGDEIESRVVNFRVERKDPIRVLRAESKRKEVRSELVTVEEGRAYEIVLTPESTESSLLGFVRIETDCEIESEANPLAYYSIR